MSTIRANRIQEAIHTSVRVLRFNRRESRSANGTANWNSTRNNATYSHPPCRRRKNHEISSGRLPDQMMSNCEKLKYVQTITKVSMNLPWSWTSVSVRYSDIGLRLPRILSITTQKQKAESASPAMKMKP